MMCHIIVRGYVFEYFQKNTPVIIPDNENGTTIASASFPLNLLPNNHVSA